MKVSITIGLTGGVVDDVEVTTPELAEVTKKKFDKWYGIVRNSDDSYDDCDNDVIQQERQILTRIRPPQIIHLGEYLSEQNRIRCGVKIVSGKDANWTQYIDMVTCQRCLKMLDK
jgi:hypothetical protein